MHLRLLSSWLLASVAVTCHASPLAGSLQASYELSDALETLRDEAVPVLNRRQDEGTSASDSGAANWAIAPSQSGQPLVWEKDGCTWTVDSRYKFDSHMEVKNSSWSSRNFSSTNANAMYFIKSDTDIGPAYFNKSQITIDSLGLLRMNQAAVPANSANTDAQSAQIVTAWSDITYGSIRTVAKGTKNPGAVYGMFFYGPDVPHYETDIELVTLNPRTVHFTNQNDTMSNSTETTLYGSSTISSWHEYRLDWVPGSVSFYIDGVLRENKTQGVPKGPGAWYWNAWSDGGPFGQGPARQANTFFIQSIDMYANRTGLVCGK
ncbi:hypothetical protein D6C90_10018 [Aureobasidium pullulans]|uniref:GH16 domain-containing protein n=1 Tax=Aureobasidium pullulans TaxID=5580 RepID=A0A4V6THF3_AURPU|nr:hypothetical protein D6C90_10018 [Aureobasidium pullulans]